MARIAVETGQLHTAGQRQLALAEQVAAVCGPLEAAAQSAAGAAGEPAVSAAITDCAIAWSTSLALLSGSVSGLGGNVDAAGSAYTTTDANAMPAR